jgi:uncharacterized protein YndB with AHSA1/START domain
LNDQLRDEEEAMKVARFGLPVAGVAMAGAIAMGQGPQGTAGAAAPEKAFVIEVSVPAPRVEVWKAFATSEGLSTWLTPGAVVDLRPGGEWTAHFPGGKTGGGTILSFVPEQEMVLSAMAPERFPTVRAERMKARFQFESKGDFTVVRLTQTGWKTGPEWDRAYEYLTAGNAALLATLHRRFASGPLDWEQEWGAAAAKPAKK